MTTWRPLALAPHDHVDHRERPLERAPHRALAVRSTEDDADVVAEPRAEPSRECEGSERLIECDGESDDRRARGGDLVRGALEERRHEGAELTRDGDVLLGHVRVAQEREIRLFRWRGSR
jgi:hypothetical protein